MGEILILGAAGQVGSALAGLDWGSGGEDGVPWRVRALGREAADLRGDAPARLVEAARPSVVINAAAYTNVEGAQRERAAAFAVNAEGPGRLARACAQAGAWLVHYSTDYVFDGARQDAQGLPLAYVESDATAPLNVYGESKLAGEEAIRAGGCRYLILRTSWVYDDSHENFVTKVLARARSGAPLQVVNDQFGAPTWARALALATRQAVARVTQAQPAPLDGVYHLSAAGQTTWFGVAQAALEITRLEVPVTPVPAAHFPGAARRPRNSLLDSGRFAQAFGHRIGDWRAEMERCFGA